MKSIGLLGLVSLCALFHTGCVVGRRTVALPVPASAAPAASKGEFAVSEVTDARAFENKPSEPSTPSIDGDITQVSKDQLATMIGRQRNGYGGAMGDIALPPPDTVKTKAAELVTEGLRRNGYTVTKGAGGANTLAIKVDEFWAWFHPGFVSVGFEAHLLCKVTLKLGAKTATLTVRGTAENRGQIASDENWQLAYSRAFEDFLKNFDSELHAAGF